MEPDKYFVYDKETRELVIPDEALFNARIASLRHKTYSFEASFEEHLELQLLQRVFMEVEMNKYKNNRPGKRP